MQDKIFIVLLGFFLTISTALAASWSISPETKAGLQKLANIRIFDKKFYGGDLKIENIDGHSYKLSEIGAKPQIVILWASWCVPCRQELPELASIYPNANFDILPVNIDKTSNEKLKKFISSIKLANLPIYRDDKSTLFDILRSNSLIFGLPTALIFNKNHYLIAAINGKIDWHAKQMQDFLQHGL